MNDNIKIIVEKYLKSFKNVCDLWKFNNVNNRLNDYILCDISTNNSIQYDYLKKEYDELVFAMLQELILSILDSNKINYTNLDFKSFHAKPFIIQQKLVVNHPHDINNELAIILSNEQDTIYLFKEFGIQNQIENNSFHSLFPKKKIRYVNYVSDDAFKEIINHNNNISDPYRGTNVISLKDFLIMFVNEEAWVKLYKECNRFSQESKEYFSFEIIKNVRNSNLFSYRETVEKSIKNFNYQKFLPNISLDQFERICESYFESELYKCMVGKSIFAQSFMTAEWLYISLRNAENVDLTPISAGFFKALEQFLDLYVSLLINKVDPKTNKPYVIHLNGHSGHVEITEKRYQTYRNKLSLKNLTDLFGYYNKDKNLYIERNQGLLCSGIDHTTYHIIIQLLSDLAEIRNGYFHKDNIQDWSIIDKVRTYIYSAFFLILGSFNYFKENINILGIVNLDSNSFYQLCHYIYTNLRQPKLENSSLLVPVFKIDKIDELLIYCEDSKIAFDDLGNPMYLNIKFKNIGPKKLMEKTYTKNNLPKSIKFTFLSFNPVDNPYKHEPEIKNFKTIFENGKFIKP